MTVICQPTLDIPGVKILFGAIPAAYAAGGVLTVTGSGRKIFFYNTTDQGVWVTLNGGTGNPATDFILVPSNGSFALDWDNSMHWSGIIAIRYDSAPASGYVSIGVIRGV